MESKARHHDGLTGSLGLRPKKPTPRRPAANVGQEAASFFGATAFSGHQNAHVVERILGKRKRQVVALAPAVHRLHDGGKLLLGASAAAPVLVLADWTPSAVDRDNAEAATPSPELDLSLKLWSSSSSSSCSSITAPDVDLSLRLRSGPRSTTMRRENVTQPPVRDLSDAKT